MAIALRRLAAAALLAGAGAGPAALAQLAPPTPVEETPLVRDAFSTGLLSRPEGALEGGLWRGAAPATLNFLLGAAPGRPAGPALGEALRRILLTPGDAPEGASPSLGGRKLLALARAGFSGEARTIASLSSAPRSDPYVAEALAVADLLAGATADACGRNAGLSAGQGGPFWVKLRLLCYAAADERDAADLTLALLREQGLLSDRENVLFSALVTGAAPKEPAAPASAIDLAAVRLLKLPLGPALPDEADAGVLRAVAEDGALEPAMRVAAANAAAAAGAMPASELQALYSGFKLDVAEISGAAERARARPDDPMADVALYQAISQMTAPEFLRDKAARIAEALSIADSFARAHAAAILYAEDIVALEGALLPPAEAVRFAVARMAVGDGDGAARWLFAALGSGGLSALEESLAMGVIDLTNLLAVLDPISAAAVAEAAGVALDDANARAPAPAAIEDDHFFARIVEAAFDAAIADIPGQAGLAALAASDAAPPGDPVAAAVISQSLRAAGLNELRRRVAFESAWRARFAPAPEAGGAGEAEGDADYAGDQEGPAPRLKPKATP